MVHTVVAASNAALPAWSVRLISELDDADRRAREVTRGLDAAALNWRPRPDSWSIGQCLHHLFLANEVYLPPIAAALEGCPRSRCEEITPGWFSRWFIRTYIAPVPPGQRIRRKRAPRKIVPDERIETSILELFVRSNGAARDLVRRASEHDVNRIRFRNPFVALIRFTVGTGLEIICQHQQRHLLQAARVRQSPVFPMPGAV